MTVLLRAAVATACRRIHSPRRLPPQPILKEYAANFPPPSYLSSVAREESEDDGTSSAITSRADYWNDMYRQFHQYVEEHGHAHVPIQYSVNPSLGRWVDTQRHQYRLRQRGAPCTLTEEREQLLNQLGMVWNIRDYQWEENYEELLEYYYMNDHVNVPGRYPGGLGRWVYKQRRDFAARQRGEVTRLTTERMVRLSILGMIWNIPEASWEEFYQQLVDFKMKHGHTNVPTDAQDSFSAWVHNQRSENKKFRQGEYSRMTQERIDKLNELNFEWDYQEAVWLERYEELRQYRKEHGDWYDFTVILLGRIRGSKTHMFSLPLFSIVPKTYASNPFLGRWVGQQREQYKKFQDGKAASITPERIKLLNEIEFVWNVRDALWRQRLEELQELVKVNGFGIAPPRTTHQTLARWLQRQQQAYEKMKNGEKVAMNKERANELRKLGFLNDD